MAVTGSVIREPDEFRMHADFAKAISLNHEQAVFCVVLYQEHLPRSYVNGVFSILCDSFETLLKQQQKDFVKNRSVTDYFLMDLLDNPDTPAEQIKERLLYNDLDFDGYFLTISLHCELIQKQTESYFIQFLRNNMINCRIFAYHETIVILYHLPQSVSYRAHITNLFERLLLEYHTISMQLYVSKPYYQVSHFAAGYQQAENIAALLPDGQKKAAMHTVFFYEDHWLADFINQNPARDKTFFYGEAVLIDLMNKNTKKSKKQLQILMEYLNCGQNYTDVATHLGMHRNNVIYHIKSLSEAYHLNLEDSGVRLRLLLSYQIIKGDS
jgi:sugar diacid utilization regulator